ncbi:MAG: hypothetical protein MZV63_12810 [Marinilabiliales bacterium]|nr:hypothetical protein [Marinilabiliales bacterium]
MLQLVSLVKHHCLKYLLLASEIIVDRTLPFLSAREISSMVVFLKP